MATWEPQASSKVAVRTSPYEATQDDVLERAPSPARTQQQAEQDAGEGDRDGERPGELTVRAARLEDLVDAEQVRAPDDADGTEAQKPDGGAFEGGCGALRSA